MATTEDTSALVGLAQTVARLEVKLDASREERRAAEEHTKNELREIKDQAKLTNGRVNTLEGFRDQLAGGLKAVGIVLSLGGGGLAFATRLFGLL